MNVIPWLIIYPPTLLPLPPNEFLSIHAQKCCRTPEKRGAEKKKRERKTKPIQTLKISIHPPFFSYLHSFLSFLPLKMK